MKKELVEGKLKKLSATQLLAKLEKGGLTDLQKEICIEILNKRGRDTSKFTSTQEPEVAVEPVTPKVEVKESAGVDPLKTLKDEVDSFVESLILEKRIGLFAQVMKALGGGNNSNMEDLFEVVTEEQLKEALSFNKIKKPIIEAKAGKPEKGAKTGSDKPKSDKPEKSKGKTKTSGIITESKEMEGLKKGVKVSFTLSKKRGGAEATGVMVRVHLRGDKEFILIKLDDKTIVSKRPSGITIIK